MGLYHRALICLLGANFAMVFLRPDEYPGAGAWEPDTALLAVPVVLHTGEGLVRAVWRRVRLRLGPGQVRLRNRRRPRAWPRTGTALVGVGRLSQIFGQGLICYLVYDVLKLWIELAFGTVRLTWMSPGLVFDLWLTGALLSYAGQLLMRRGARLRVRVHGSPEAALRDADVLYLRPFTVDSSARQVPMGVPIVQLTAAPAFFQAPGLTAEERLVRSLGAVGTGVALGAPGERLPSAGCDRLYLPLAGWQPVVARLVDRARLTVLVVVTAPEACGSSPRSSVATRRSASSSSCWDPRRSTRGSGGGWPTGTRARPRTGREERERPASICPRTPGSPGTRNRTARS
ncbi:hypothetical protein C0Q59_12490 [Streptomyces albidoflavus]|uniref:hypothetical protein n=1 Tax=Streptomyces albidoflavus TaxID=1886 RepID=UPI00101F95E9|nr:hypothetical protein [Streptomyces albidoflavus]RZD62646.1 hypothetical protein C0Q59_12490 [Streptomyces albidoflavus]